MHWFPQSVYWGALLIFCLRVTDVSLSVVRTIMTVKGRNWVAGGIAFVEVTIFVIAISQVLRNIAHPIQIFAYSGGYAAGTVIGGYVEKWLALGHVMISVHCKGGDRLLAGELRHEGFGVTTYEAAGKDGPIQVVEIVVLRKDFVRAMDIVHAVAPEAFAHTQEALYIHRGFMPRKKYK
jgi:uncharacterized protein YebE (UPF0316 family)